MPASFRGSCAGRVARLFCLGFVWASVGAGLWVYAPNDALAAKAKKPRTQMAREQTQERLPGGETPAERERRLLRECKGRPNAGACSGYAR